MLPTNDDQQRDGLYLTRTQTTRVVAGVLLCVLFVFVGGYFWGKRAAADALLGVTEQGAVNDGLAYSLYTTYHEDEQEKDVCDQVEIQPVITRSATLEGSKEKPEKTYCAHLIGYGKRISADNFVSRLAKKNITAFVRERKSHSVAGKKSPTWYQVVTDTFHDRQELLTLVDKIKKEERISDVSIVTL